MFGSRALVLQDVTWFYQWAVKTQRESLHFCGQPRTSLEMNEMVSQLSDTISFFIDVYHVFAKLWITRAPRSSPWSAIVVVPPRPLTAQLAHACGRIPFFWSCKDQQMFRVFFLLSFNEDVWPNARGVTLLLRLRVPGCDFLRNLTRETNLLVLHRCCGSVVLFSCFPPLLTMLCTRHETLRIY